MAVAGTAAAHLGDVRSIFAGKRRTIPRFLRSALPRGARIVVIGSSSVLAPANWREPELRRRLVVDPHSPGQFRGIGPHVTLPAWYEAWSIPESSPMFRPPAERAKIW